MDVRRVSAPAAPAAADPGQAPAAPAAREAATIAEPVATAEASPGPSDDDMVKKVTFCHATASDTHPYVLVTTSVNGFDNAGHIDHAGDVYPAFSFVKGGTTHHVTASGALASTGTDVTAPALLNGILLAAGGTLIGVRRRHRSTT